MALTIEEAGLPGVLLIKPDVFHDDRGFFAETYHLKKYTAQGLPVTFVQDNHSRSVKGVVRGLHYQLHYPQGKLIVTIRGEIFDVAVDIRRGSPTFGRWVGHVLSDTNRHQLYVPEGFAHGFCVLSNVADVVYKCTEFFHPEDDRGILWSDPDIGIPWPIDTPLISDKDSRHPLLRTVAQDLLPCYIQQTP
ncbi:MAG: dTDP-4-dehydrorhamnose 3,5-epimerase [Desulfobacterota bacterium]|nr:dTDP-4-dehydrorhamnose 3,5-epimerase [Thermodesulfobacteriota bacterium]